MVPRSTSASVQRSPTRAATCRPTFADAARARLGSDLGARRHEARPQPGQLVRSDHAVDQAVVARLRGCEVTVSVHVVVDTLPQLARVPRIDAVDVLAQLEDLAGVDLD